MTHSSIDVRTRLHDFAQTFDPRFEELLQNAADVPDRLAQAVRYSALGSGKRLRPYLVVRCCALVGGDTETAMPIAAAIECLHAFSLIHDDLPAMDDDDLRRGRPSCHKQFDEATAVLAGDALVLLAFELVARHAPDPTSVGRLVLELAEGVGWRGMIGGQMADIVGQTQSPDLAITDYIQVRKTARLFAASCRIGAIVGGGDDDAIDRVGAFGQTVGMAFQIADDLLDLTASSQQIGKRTGKDVDANKQTVPRCVGVDEGRKRATAAARVAVEQLEPFGDRAADLRDLALFMIGRDY